VWDIRSPARTAVRKVPLGGDNLDRDVGKIRGPLREDANGPDAGLWAPRIMKRYAWKVFSFRLLLLAPRMQRSTRSGFAWEAVLLLWKRDGARAMWKEEKGKWVRTKGRVGREKWRGGGAKMPGGQGAWTTRRRKGNRRKAGIIEREKIRPVLAVYGHVGKRVLTYLGGI
jgi:hypothetical protein